MEADTLHSSVCQGKYAEAELLYERATEIWEKALGPDHSNLATVLLNRATLFNTQVRCEQSAERFQIFINFCMILETFSGTSVV